MKIHTFSIDNLMTWEYMDAIFLEISLESCRITNNREKAGEEKKNTLQDFSTSLFVFPSQWIPFLSFYRTWGMRRTQERGKQTYNSNLSSSSLLRSMALVDSLEVEARKKDVLLLEGGERIADWISDNRRLPGVSMGLFMWIYFVREVQLGVVCLWRNGSRAKENEWEKIEIWNISVKFLYPKVFWFGIHQIVKE